MLEITFCLSVLAVFIVGRYGRKTVRRMLCVMNVCHDDVLQQCRYSHFTPQKKVEERHHKCDVSPLSEDFQVLGKMGYYLASNDEETLRTFTVTPLQDTDPKDLA